MNARVAYTDVCFHKDSMSDLINKALEQARLRLLDLTNRNRLINYRESARCIAIVDELPSQVCERLFDDKLFTFLPYDGPEDRTPPSELPLPPAAGVAVPGKHKDGHLQTPYSTKDLKTRLRKLVGDYRTILEETGASSVFLAMGFLRYRDSEDSQVWQRAPLLLLPVTIEREFGGWEPNAFSIRMLDDELQTNRSLLHKLDSLSVRLPEIEKAWVSSPGSDEATFSPEAYFASVARALRANTAKDWRVERQMSIGVFRFQKQALWRDLDPENWPARSPVTGHALVRRILLGPQGESRPPGALPDLQYSDPDEIDGHTKSLPLVLDADSSQVQALHHALQAQDGLVIEGPPGTGKSQTIANLIAAAIAQGKSVLFVAEKLAALEVVSKRLAEKGLDPYCLSLHGLNSNRKTFYEGLQKRLAHTPRYSATSVEQARRELSRVRNILLDLSELLTTQLGPLELPAHEVVWRVEQLRQRLPDSLPLHTLTVSTNDAAWFQNHKLYANEYAAEWHAIPAEAREAWIGFTPRSYSDQHRSAVLACFAGTKDQVAALREATTSAGLAEALGSPVSVSRVLTWRKREPAARVPPLPETTTPEVVQAILSCGSLSQTEEFLAKCAEYLSLRQELSRVLDLTTSRVAVEAATALLHINRIAGLCDTSATTLDHCAELADAHQDIRATIASVSSKATGLAKLLSLTPRRLSDYTAVTEAGEQLIDAPAGMNAYAFAGLAHPRAAESLMKAAEKSAELRDDLKQCDLLDPERVTDCDGALAAIADVEACAEAWFPFVSKKYRRAKGYLSARLRSGARFSRKPEILAKLRKQLSICRNRDAFGQNKEYLAALGPVFTGIDTDWERARELVAHATTLRQHVGQENARSLLASWEKHESALGDVVGSLQSSLKLIEEFRRQHAFYAPDVWLRPLNDIADALGRTQAIYAEAADYFRDDRISIATNLTVHDAKHALSVLFPRHQKLRAEIDLHPFLAKLCGVSSAAEIQSITHLQLALRWLSGVADAPGVSEELLPWLLPAEETLARSRNLLLSEISEKTHDTLRTLSNLLQGLGDFRLSAYFGSDALLQAIPDKLLACEATLDALPALQRIGHLRTRLRDAGLDPITIAIEQGIIKDSVAGDWLDLAVHSVAYEAFAADNPCIQAQSNTAYETTRRAAAETDKQLFALNAEQIAASLHSNRCPQGNATGTVSSFTELGLIRHQISLKKRHLPIRQLMSRAGKSLKALKPCFLMSPLSVAQYLPPGEIHFDLVVMDEASQIRPEDAIGAIARGSNCVIVGDPNQLPPTSFFDGADPTDGDELDEQTLIVNTESILDVCLTQLPMRRLTWHYRSQHERLIQFSNDQFYDGKLKVFPSPAQDSPTHGVRGTLVTAPSYRKGGYNRGEAEVVVQKAIWHLRRGGDDSLGIVAMNKRQAEEIEVLLEAERRKDPALERRVSEMRPPLFVKNLENVQGDERDIILISTTYGPSAPGEPVAQRFGPINSSVGHRRLNVIATRAKKCVEVITSLRPSDILVGNNASAGTRAFRDYLSYVFTGKVPDRGTFTGRAAESPFEEAVAYHIRAMGLECEPQIGVAGFFVDIGIRHPGRPGEFLLGVECDGATYHSSRSVRDRDRLRQEILESKGWRIHRIWSTSWFYDRGTEIARLRKAVADELARQPALHDPKTAAEPSAAEPPPREEPPQSRQRPSDTPVSVAAEEADREDALEMALERYWRKEISPDFPDRSNSVLSPEMIALLVTHRPHSLADFVALIPDLARRGCDTKQARFLNDICELIREFA
jgi:very-short-patch-repair endonuclease